MSKELILITGVSGHVGFRVLVEALNQGYRVRAVVRKAEQEEKIRNAASIKPFAKDLEFTVVQDLLKEGAFDNELDRVSGVIHVASPLGFESDDYKRDLIDPAVNATTGMLKSAAKAQSVKRVVITSSVATLVTLEYLMSDDHAKVFTVDDVYTPPPVQEQYPSPMVAYAMSKCYALAASEKFMKEEKPQYDLISILPSMVIGKNELNMTKKEAISGTNAIVLGLLTGRKADEPTLGVSVHVDDVARLHVNALKPSVPGNQRLMCSSEGPKGTTWDDAKEIAQRLYSKQVSDGLLDLSGTTPSKPLRLDSSKSEEVLGRKFLGFEEQVKSVVDHYIEAA
ncbi:hypothetical protein NX059_002786 [Plenodomus lindquistii]|nr:hypothetical protein NX059_002786 [Plenodomus lindquistii]